VNPQALLYEEGLSFLRCVMGKFFVIEGLDGSGKTTQIARLSRWFAEKNLPCFTTRQPSDGRIGELARSATSLNRGEYVICDRYYYSNLVYQGVDSAMFERILAYNQAVMRSRKPDAVIFLDVPPEESMRRISARRSEASIFEALDKLKIFRERYLETFERLKKTENVIIIESTDKNAVFEKIMNKIRPLCSI
jgi:dTMP kinase